MPNFHLTPRAVKDLEQIAEYGLNQWGETMRNAFIDDIFEVFSKIAEEPLLTKERNDIKSDYRCRYFQSYAIFYMLLVNGDCSIIGILHQAMDVQSRL